LHAACRIRSRRAQSDAPYLTPRGRSLLRDGARMRHRARPRSWTRPVGRHNINHTSHSSKAMLGTKVRISASLCKSKLINEARVVKYSCVTVHVIRRAELSVGCARLAVTAGDTVKIAGPGPSHSVAHKYVERVRHKLKFIVRWSYRHIEDLATNQSPATWHLTAILIENGDGRSRAFFRCRASAAVVVGFSCR